MPTVIEDPATAELDVLPPAVTERAFNFEYCDACGHGASARAHYVIAFDESELAFCNHHFNKFESKFKQSSIIRLVVGD